MYRIGIGMDVHRLVSGKKLMLGCVEIPYSKGLAGHSDADVVVHSIVDAILGAIGERDIGYLYPPQDEKWRNYPGKSFLRDMRHLMKIDVWMIINIDSVVIAQEPKLSPYIPTMKAAVATHLGISPNIVSIKATTTEGLGFTGRGEGIGAQAVVLLKKIDTKDNVDQSFI